MRIGIVLMPVWIRIWIVINMEIRIRIGIKNDGDPQHRI